jgi:thiol-disulfide isomerase/thioredoxin
MVMSEENKEQLSPLYYFYSQGCGFCKKSEPIIDELNKEGHDILKLDLADKDNAAINKELKEKYKAQCGTPWFINAETGHQICGFREKDIVEKWVKGEEIPEPPRPKGPPPPPPQDMENKDQVEEWKTKYEAWVKENDHMPNLPPSDQMLQRIKQQKKMMEQRQAQQGIGGNLEARMSVMEQKLDRLLKHLGVNTGDIKPPSQKPPVINNPPRKVPAPPASKKPAKKKRAKGGK